MAMRKSLLLVLVVALGACNLCGAPAVVKAKPPAPAMVQVENAPGSDPHAGLGKADFVFEYLTEGGITRFTAVYFNPSGSFKVEPVRSARLVTIKLVQAYHGVLFYSGASNHVYSIIQADHLPSLNESSSGGKYFSRDSSREAPHNLYTSADRLASGVKASGLHRDYSLPPSGTPSGSGQPATKIDFDQTPAHHVTCTFAGGTYAYQGVTDADTGRPIAITNVIVMQVAHHGAGYTEDVEGAEGIDFDLSGTGAATLYTGGKKYDAKWDLSSSPLKFLASDGKALHMPHGLTWVFLVDPGTQITGG